MTHQYFREVRGEQPNTRCRQIAAHILNSYIDTPHSISKWKKRGPFQIDWTDKGTPKHARLEFNELVRTLHHDGKANMAQYDAPPLMSDLFDAGVDVGLPTAVVACDGNTVPIRLPLAMGDTFPLIPAIDREGFGVADMQTLVELNISVLFHRVIATSHDAPLPRSGWLSNFRMLLNDCVTSVDMMLHKAYMLAEYRGAELNWHFDSAKMGTRHGTRLADKFRWISQVSGRPFCLLPNIKQSFDKIKKLRNHLTHFDPPCFAATLSEVSDWLNCVTDVGDVLWAIRKHLGQPLSESTVEVLLLPRIEFVGLSTFDRTPPALAPTVGYKSASWSND